MAPDYLRNDSRAHRTIYREPKHRKGSDYESRRQLSIYGPPPSRGVRLRRGRLANEARKKNI